MKENKFVAGILISLLVLSMTPLWTPTASATEQNPTPIRLPFYTSWETLRPDPMGRINSVLSVYPASSV